MKRRPRTVSEREVRAIFVAQRAAFARHAPSMARVGLTIVDSECPTGRWTCAPRDLAWMERQHVYILRRAFARGRSVVAGLLAHELGHAMDPLVWEAGSELRADAFAELALGRPVRYTRDDAVQTLGRGTSPCPSHLHQ